MAEVLSRAADLDDEDLQQEYISLCSFDSVDVGIRISGHAVIAVMRCAILCACCTASVKGACMTHSTLNTHEKSWQHDGKTKYITGYCDTNVHDTVPLPLMLLVMMNAQMVMQLMMTMMLMLVLWLLVSMTEEKERITFHYNKSRRGPTGFRGETA